MEKDFDGWNVQKKRIDREGRPASAVTRRSIWWSDFGVNVGHEHDGNPGRFERPVLVLKTFGNETCLVVPLTRSERGGRFRFDLEQFGYRSRVALDQLRLVSTKRLTRWIEDLDVETFMLVHEAVKKINGFS